MKHIVIGILAHVDAGKTTLSEAMLYQSGHIRKIGRVDTGDSFLDTYSLERERGITIFSKQAAFKYKDMSITLVDTPGHVDFSAEMERTLQVLDYAILVINGADGVQSHTRTLWSLLEKYNIPTFLFVNKMDQENADAAFLNRNIQARLSDTCIDFSNTCLRLESDLWYEQLSLCSEEALEAFLEQGKIPQNMILSLIRERKLFPTYFGSALKLQGVDTFMNGLNYYSQQMEYGEEFKGLIYKIARDDQGSRLTYLKVTGGSLKVRDFIGEEKVTQIRSYSGEKYKTIAEAMPGTICAVLGLNDTYAGQRIGYEDDSELPVLEPTLRYSLLLPREIDAYKMYGMLQELQEEDPLLHIEWEEETKTIYVRLMGDIQTEILKRMILERFDIPVSFGSGKICYKETIANTVEGIGHFEPLRHYAEVHLKLEPGQPGSGLVFDSDCSEDLLAKNWQRLIRQHLGETNHPGVLTGSAITDMKITILAGRAHKKHTVGGDFRQATYRAIRQGLKKAESVLLEPVYRFRLEIPNECLGKAMTDIGNMHGKCNPPKMEEDCVVLTGSGPVSELRDYHREVIAYSKGLGKLSLTLAGYMPCHNQEEVVDEIGYDSELDLRRPTGSVFCAGGHGFNVPWDQVEEYMHVNGLDDSSDDDQAYVRAGGSVHEEFIEPEEVDAIIAKTSHANSSKKPNHWKRQKAEASGKTIYHGKAVPKKECLLVDGYNIVFAWPELQELAQVNIDSARDKLIDIMCNYQGYRKCTLILVFDAYKVKNNPGSISQVGGIHVVYTKEAETADQYIEKTVHEMSSKYQVRVATSDGLEQMIILGEGGTRVSAREFLKEVEDVDHQIEDEIIARKEIYGNYLLNALDLE